MLDFIKEEKSAILVQRATLKSVDPAKEKEVTSWSRRGFFCSRLMVIDGPVVGPVLNTPSVQ